MKDTAINLFFRYGYFLTSTAIFFLVLFVGLSFAFPLPVNADVCWDTGCSSGSCGGYSCCDYSYECDTGESGFYRDFCDGCGGGGGSAPYTSIGGQLRVLLVSDITGLTWPMTEAQANNLVSTGRAEWVVNASADVNACTSPPGIRITDITQACKTTNDVYGRVANTCDYSLTCGDNSLGTFAFLKSQQANFTPTWYHNSTYLSMGGTTYRQLGVEIEPGDRPASLFYYRPSGLCVDERYSGSDGECHDAKYLPCVGLYASVCILGSTGRCGGSAGNEETCLKTNPNDYTTRADWKPERTGELLELYPPNSYTANSGRPRIEQTFRFRVDLPGTYRFMKPEAYKANTATMTVTGPGLGGADGFANNAYQTSDPGFYPYTATVVCTEEGYSDGKSDYRNSVCGYGLPVSPPQEVETVTQSSVVQYAVIFGPGITPSPSPSPSPSPQPITGNVWEREDGDCLVSGAAASSAAVDIFCTYDSQTALANLAGGEYTCVDPTDGDTLFPVGSTVSVSLDMGSIPAGTNFSCQVGSSSVTVSEGSAGDGPDFILSRVFDAWFQTRGGDLFANYAGISQAIRSLIPETCTGACESYLSLPDLGSLQPGSVSRASGTQNLGDAGGEVSSTGWQARAGSYEGIRADYAFWRQHLSDELVEKEITSNPGAGFWLATNPGTLTISGNWNVDAGDDVIVIYEGDVAVNANQTVNPGGSLMIVASGTITFGTGVTNAQGVYIAETITTETGGSQNDSQFTGEGTFIGWTNILLNRDLGLGNNTQPAELFIYRPDIVYNLPTEVKRSLYTWREVP